MAFHEMELAAGVALVNALARVVDLRNANAAGVAFENRRRAVAGKTERYGEDGGARYVAVFYSLFQSLPILIRALAHVF